MAGSSSRRTRVPTALRVGLPVAAAGLAGFVVTTMLRSARAEEGGGGLPGLTTSVVYAAETEDGSLVTKVGEGVRILDSRKPARFLFWSQPTFTGELSEESCRKLIALGKAVALEHRLGAGARARLRKEVHDADQELRAMHKLYDSELERVKEALRERPDRQVVIRAKPRKSDPRWPEVLRLYQELDNSRAGTVVGAPLGDRTDAVVYYAVRWREWPLLRRLNDRRHAASTYRKERAGAWIASEFSQLGMEILR